MNFTAKEDYGLRAVLDIAAQTNNGPVQTHDIAVRQQIPEQFLEQLLASLRRAEVVRSTRGAGGGYTLALPPSQVTVAHILRALSGPLVPTELVKEDETNGVSGKTGAEIGVIRGVWNDLHRAIENVAERTSLQELLDRRSEHLNDSCFMMNI